MISDVLQKEGSLAGVKNLAARAGNFAKAVGGGQARVARAEATSAKKLFADAQKKWTPEITGTLKPGNPSGKSLAERAPMFKQVDPAKAQQGRQAIARAAAGMAKSKTRAAELTAQTARARKNLAVGAAGTAAAGAGAVVGGHVLKRKLNSQAPIPPQQVKVSALSEAERKRRAHAYYVQNRQRILVQKRTYRKQNKPKIALQQRQYRRELKYGKKKRQRISTGGHSYVFGGFA